MPIGEWNDFRSYLYRTGLGIVAADKTKKVKTHLLLDGGKLSVPPEREKEFLARYAKELVAGTDLWVVEMKTEPCFFFMSEFDIKFETRAITLEEILTVSRIVQGVVARAFTGSEHPRVLAISTAAPKDSHDTKGRPCIQSGVHFNWRIPLDLDTAWVLRSWIIRELEQKMPAAEFGMLDTWMEAYDPCVLKDNGLRMIGSRKAEVCPVCKGRSFKRGPQTTPTASAADDVCAACQNVGRVDKGRPYSLTIVLDEDGDLVSEAVEHFRKPENAIELVQFLSLRCIDVERPETILFDSPDAERRMREAAVNDRKAVCKKPTKAGAKPEAAAAAQKEKKRDDLVDLAPGDEAFDVIAKYLLTEYSSNPIVTRIKKTGGSDCYIANTRCHFCENKNAEHGHSNVYFVLKASGCVQRCFCLRCTSFVGRQRKIPEDLLGMLFPNHLVAAQRKAERRVELAARVFDTGRFINVVDDAIAPAVATRYGDPTGIALPPLSTRAAQGMRRRGVASPKDFQTLRASAFPPYTINRFLEDMKRDGSYIH